MRKLLLLLALAPFVGAQDIDKLIERHAKGDKKAVTEAVLLGEPGVKALLDRLTRARFAAKPLGAEFPKDRLAHKTKDMVQLRFDLLQTKAPRGPATPRLLSAKEFEAMKALDGSKLVTAPQLTVFNAQLANVTVAEQTAYTKAYDEQKLAVRGVVSTGTVLDARARIRAKKGSIDLDLRCVTAALAGGKIPTLKTPSGEIGVPQVIKREVVISLNVKPNAKTYLLLPRMGPLVVVIDTGIIPAPKPAAPK